MDGEAGHTQRGGGSVNLVGWPRRGRCGRTTDDYVRWSGRNTLSSRQRSGEPQQQSCNENNAKKSKAFPTPPKLTKPGEAGSGSDGGRDTALKEPESRLLRFDTWMVRALVCALWL
jgi:hypothetical protein